MPKRDRKNGDLSTLKDFHHDFRKENGGRCASDPPKGAERFYRLPPEKRPAAEVYYSRLCSRWATRLKRTPGFARILHMITLNQFKNPGQSRSALKHSLRVQRSSMALRRRLEQTIFTDTTRNTPAPRVRSVRLGTF